MRHRPMQNGERQTSARGAEMSPHKVHGFGQQRLRFGRVFLSQKPPSEEIQRFGENRVVFFGPFTGFLHYHQGPAEMGHGLIDFSLPKKHSAELFQPPMEVRMFRTQGPFPTGLRLAQERLRSGVITSSLSNPGRIAGAINDFGMVAGEFTL